MYEKSFLIFYSSFRLCFLLILFKKMTILSLTKLLRPGGAGKTQKSFPAMEYIFEKFILIGVREFFIRLLRRHKRHAIAKRKFL